jgi:hypothetical protein
MLADIPLEKIMLTTNFMKGEVHAIRKSTKDIFRFPQVG